MWANYILVALENLKRQPAFSAIKVLSMAIGLGCSILVLMHMQYAFSFDRHFPNSENIYRLVSGFTTEERIEFNGSSDAYAPQMRLDYPQIENIARIRPGRGFFARGDAVSANEYYWAEPEIVDIFSLEFVRGDGRTALDEPNTVVLSETAAAKYFPGEDPLGQTLTLDEQAELRVSGVMRDLPENTHLDFEILVSVPTGRQLFGENFMASTTWTGFGTTLTYLTLPDQTQAEVVAADLAAFVERNLPERQRAFEATIDLRLSLQPLHDIYLGARAGFGQTNNRPQVLFGLGIFAALILLTSCINFGNLSLAQIRQRNREIGVRKTLGAKRGQIVVQFLFEALLLTLIALLLALPVVYLSIPAYAALTGTNFTFGSALAAGSAGILVSFVVATGLLSGLVPAFVLARFEPAAIIKGVEIRGNRSGFLRAGVTVLQFGFSTTLILLALAISLQIRYLNTMETGFDKNNLVVLDSTFDARNPENFDYDAMVNELRQHPGILAVGKSNLIPPATGPYARTWHLPGDGPDNFRGASHILVDVGYFDTMGFNLVAGRWFSAEFGTDIMSNQLPADATTARVYGVVITRRMVSGFGFASPEAALDQIIVQGNFSYRVIGVVENFRQSGGLEDETQSTGIMRASRDPLRVLLLRIDPEQAESALAHIDAIWARHRPATPINRTFFNQTFNDLVFAETNGISTAATFASIVTILISAFGLYTLAFHATQRRMKEIGMRKVVGATTKKIVVLLTWEFLKPVLIACALACGVGYLAINVYFQQFSARAEISPLLYAVVTMGTLLVAILTVATQCYRAANADPVKSLRYE